MLYFLLVLVSFGASLALTPWVRLLAVRFGAVDRPGERKVHTVPIPRLGGVSIVLSTVVSGLVALGVRAVSDASSPIDVTAWGPLLVGGAVVFLIGLWDDIRPVPSWVKFLFQFAAAGVVVWFGIRIDRVSLLGSEPIELGILALPITFLWIVGITNAFNLVDGLDGLAAGLASIAAGTSAVIFLLGGDVHDAMLLLILLGALLGFLRYNFNPATVFLGDSGSLFVGYILAVTAIRGSQKGATSLAVATPLLIFGLPILDTLLSMVRRFVGGLFIGRAKNLPIRDRILSAKRMFKPDQRHIHHQLVALGFSHRKAVLVLYAFAVALSLLALLSLMAQYRNAGIILLVVGLATYIGIHKLGYEEVAFLKPGPLLRWYEQLAFNRLFFLGFADIVLISASYWGAFLLKYQLAWPTELGEWYLDVFPLALMSQLGVFSLFGLYRGVWRAMGVGDLIRIGSAVGAAVALSYSVAVVASPPEGTLAFFCINLFVLGALAIGARSAHRLLDYLRQREGLSGRGTALIYGAGRGGELVLQELLQNPGLGLRPIGFLDDKPSLHRRTINRIMVLGSGDELASVLDRYQVTALIISSDKIGEDRLWKVINLCRERHIAVLRGRLRIEAVGTQGIPSLHAHEGRMAVRSGTVGMTAGSGGGGMDTDPASEVLREPVPEKARDRTA